MRAASTESLVPAPWLLTPPVLGSLYTVRYNGDELAAQLRLCRVGTDAPEDRSSFFDDVSVAYYVTDNFAPAIATAESQYEQMWAQDAAAMTTYAQDGAHK